MPRERLFLLLAALLALTAVGAGAFGAHILRTRISPDMLATFETAARYQMYHALALFGTALALTQWPVRSFAIAGWLFVVGSVIFSGSLYTLALTGARWWGAVAPLGGVAFLLGWAAVAWGAWVSRGSIS